MYEYLTSGSIIVDNVIPFGATEPTAVQLGGGVMYALSGLKVWTDEVFVAACAGRDFDALYGDWMARNHCPTEGIVTAFDRTCNTDLTYLANGTYKVSDCKQLPLTIPHMQLLEPFFHRGLRGVHLLVHANIELFSQLDRARREYGFKVGHEWATSPTFYRARELFVEVANRYVDYISLSLIELQHLYPEITGEQDALAFLQELDCATFFRMGTKGAYMIVDHKATFSPLVSAFGDNDPTGCGNTSTAAAFWAFCEGKSPLECAMVGAVTASLNAGFFGMIPEVTPQTRAQCRELVHRLIAENQSEGRKIV